MYIEIKDEDYNRTRIYTRHIISITEHRYNNTTEIHLTSGDTINIRQTYDKITLEVEKEESTCGEV